MFIKLTFLLPLVVLSLAHPIDHIDLARDGEGGKGGDLDVVSVLNGLLSNIICLLSSLLGGILKKGHPIDPAMLQARSGGSGDELVDLDLTLLNELVDLDLLVNLNLSGVNGLLINICCLLNGLLGGILKKGHPINPAMLQARSDGSGDELVDLDLTLLNELVDLDLLVNLNLSGVNGLLINICCLLNGLLGGILKKGHSIDPAMLLARRGGSVGSLMDVAPKVDLSCLLANIVCLLSGLLGNILKTHPINQDVLARGTLLRGADTRSEFEGNVPLNHLVNLEALLHSAIAGGEKGKLAGAELGRKIFNDGVAKKNFAKADRVLQFVDKSMRGNNGINEAAANVKLTKK